jgi:hypothetical protein
MEIDNSPIEEFRNQFKIKKAPVTKEFISKTTFLSFPGLTGRLGRLAEERESRKTLDARLSLSSQAVSGETSGMTYKDVACDVTYGRLSNYLAAEQRSVKSVILALVLASSRIGPESFCIRMDSLRVVDPASGNDKQNKTIISRSRPSKNFLIKISELLNFKFIILIFAFHF